MKKYFNILTAEASATADVSRNMFIRTLAGLNLCLPLIALMVAPTISFAAVVDDSFDDGDIATNSLGAGTGFTTFTQDDGLAPSFVTEVGGLAILGTGPSCNFCISAIASKDSFDFFGSRASWEISGTDFLGQSRNYLVVVGEDFAAFDARLNPGDTDAPGVYIRLEDNEFPVGSAPGFVGGLLVEDGTGAFDELATWNWSGIWDREGPLEVVLDVDEIGFELTVEGNLGQTNLSGVWANISSAVGFTTVWNTRDAVVGTQNQGLGGLGSMAVDRITASTVSDLLTDLGTATMSLDIQAGVGNALDSKFQNVLDSLDRAEQGNIIAAIRMLNAYILSVESQRGKELTDSEADSLVSLAQQTIERLEEG